MISLAQLRHTHVFPNVDITKEVATLMQGSLGEGVDDILKRRVVDCVGNPTTSLDW